MNDVGRLLRDADPLAKEEELSASTASDMRRAIMVAVRDTSQRAAWRPKPLLVAATVAATLIAGVTVGRLLPPPSAPTAGERPATSGVSAAASDSSRRQLQFATPGGTRIIWVFDPDFNP